MSEREFVEAFLKAQGITGKLALREELERLGHSDGEAAQMTAPQMERVSPTASADFAWHLRAWGRCVLRVFGISSRRANPTYADFEPRRRKGRRRSGSRPQVRYRHRPRRMLEPDEEGLVSTAALNAEFDSFYLENDANPRWVAKPTVAYLWARTVRCADCRAEIPLLKTRWLCRKEKKRVRLTLKPSVELRERGLRNRRGRARGQRHAAQKREHDLSLGAGTMNSSGRNVPRLRRDLNDEGHSRGGIVGTARRTYDRGGRGGAGKQGISPADRCRDRGSERGAGGARSARREDSVRFAGRVHWRGSAVFQLARGVRSAALRL